MQHEKPTYRQWAPRQAALPLFFQPWWLDAVVGPSGWEVVLARGNSGAIVGALPYHRSRKYGFIDLIANPVLTPYLGPWILPSGASRRPGRYSHAKTTLESLLTGLPRASMTFIKVHPSLEFPLPFHWAGFKSTCRYTYRIAPGTEEDVLAGMKGAQRRDIQNHTEEASVSQGGTVAEFFPLVESVFERQGKTTPFGRDLMQKILDAAEEHQQGKLWLYRLPGGRPVAGALVLWDAEYAYLLITGRSPDCPGHVQPVLVWALIRDALDRGLGFDFEGSMLPGVEHFFRSFGGELTPYLSFFRGGNRLWTTLAAAANRF